MAAAFLGEADMILPFTANKLVPGRQSGPETGAGGLNAMALEEFRSGITRLDIMICPCDPPLPSTAQVRSTTYSLGNPFARK